MAMKTVVLLAVLIVVAICVYGVDAQKERRKNGGGGRGNLGGARGGASGRGRLRGGARGGQRGGGPNGRRGRGQTTPITAPGNAPVVVAVSAGNTASAAQAAAASQISARRKLRGPGNGGPVSRWNRTVSGEDIFQTGFVNSTDNRVVVDAFVPRSNVNAASLSSGMTQYDFTNASAVVVMVRTRRGCFLLPTPAGVTLASASADVNGRNETTVTAALTPVQRNATGGRLSRDDTGDLMNSNPSVRRFCLRSPIFRTSDADSTTFPAPGAEAAGEALTSVVTLDSQVSILSEARQKRPPRAVGGGRGKGKALGRRGGRRG